MVYTHWKQKLTYTDILQNPFFLQDFYFRINSQINNLAKIPDEGKFLNLTIDLTKIKTRTAESTVWPVVLNTATTAPTVWPVV